MNATSVLKLTPLLFVFLLVLALAVAGFSDMLKNSDKRKEFLVAFDDSNKVKIIANGFTTNIENGIKKVVFNCPCVSQHYAGKHALESAEIRRGELIIRVVGDFQIFSYHYDGLAIDTTLIKGPKR